MTYYDDTLRTACVTIKFIKMSLLFFLLIKRLIMGTRSITLVRSRKPKEAGSAKKSALGGPAESQYIYEYFVCTYYQFDGNVEYGMGEWLVNFLCEFINNFSSRRVDVGFFAVKFV